jgi:hypothetical protein
VVNFISPCIILPMVDRVWLAAISGFVVFCIGGIGYAYMDYSVHGTRMFYDFKRGNCIAAYRRLIQERVAPGWPLYVSICMPLGIVIAFASILISNHLR